MRFLMELSLAQAKKFAWGAIGLAVVAVVAAWAMWMAPNSQTSSAQDGNRPAAPLTSRGYTDAPTGTVVVAGDPAGGTNLLELRIKDGQTVKRDEIIAVLSNLPKADEALRKAEANLAKLKQIHDTVLMGTRVTDIALLEATLKSSIESDKLQQLQRSRSGKPPDVKELEASLAEQGLQRERVRLELAKTTLKNDLAQDELDLATFTAQVDFAHRTREQALIRSPLDGVVVRIFSRQGERVSPAGIAKVVDMSQLRVLAEVNEQSVSRLVSGGKVKITLRGAPTAHKGTILRVAPTVKRMQRVEPDGASSTDARIVQVEIQFDYLFSMPQALGREAQVTFF
jgi:HlyD family secretion protein